MKAKSMTRREFLRRASTLSGLAALAATLEACAVQVVPETQPATQPAPTAAAATVPPAATAALAEPAAEPAATSPAGEPPMWQIPVAEPARPVTITHWRAADPQFEQILMQMAEDFKTQHPNVSIDYNTFPQEEYTAKLGMATAGGEAPIIAEYDGSYLAQYATQGLAIPMDDYVNPAYREDLIPAARDTATYEGKWWAFPNEATVMGFVVNTELLDKAGLQAPATFVEFVEAGKKLKLVDDKGNITQWGFIRPTGTGGWEMHNTWSWLWAYKASFLNDDGTAPAITSPEAIAAVQALVSIYKEYEIAPLSTADVSAFSFEAGNVAMQQNGNWMGGTLAKEYPEIKYAAQALPIPDGGDPVNCVFGGWQPCFTSAFKQADQDAQRGALLWMEYFGSSKAMTVLYTDYGVFPTRQTTLNQLKEQKLTPQMEQFLDLMSTQTRARTTHPRYLDITTAFLEEIQNAIYKDVPVETAMKDADERMRTLMNQS